MSDRRLLGGSLAGGTPMARRKPKLISELEYALLLKRADELVGCTENSPEEKELEIIAAQFNAYEAEHGLAAALAAMMLIGFE
jgi:hypothetical protein